MNSEHPLSARPVRALPAQPSLEHLKNEAKQRLEDLRAQKPRAQLTEAQLAVARDYGFASWRALKAHVDETTRKRVFAAVRAGDVEAVRRAFEGGFDPSLTDDDGRTIHRIGKAGGNDAIELLARDFQARSPTSRHGRSGAQRGVRCQREGPSRRAPPIARFASRSDRRSRWQLLGADGTAHGGLAQSR